MIKLTEIHHLFNQKTYEAIAELLLQYITLSYVHNSRDNFNYIT